MTRKKRIMGRLGKIGSRAFVSLAALRQEAEAEAMVRLQRLATGLKLVRRGEFELVEEMVKKARRQQEEIMARLAALEAKSGVGKSRGAAQAGKRQNESPSKGAKH